MSKKSNANKEQKPDIVYVSPIRIPKIYQKL